MSQFVIVTHAPNPPDHHDGTLNPAGLRVFNSLSCSDTHHPHTNITHQSYKAADLCCYAGPIFEIVPCPCSDQ